MSADSNRALLILAQLDDASGELQDVAERLHAAGARNVQVLASVGKGRRTSADRRAAAKEDDVAMLLAAELGVWGYRCGVAPSTLDIRLPASLTVHLGDQRLSWSWAASASSGMASRWQ
jgi:hypothetical protein